MGHLKTMMRAALASLALAFVAVPTASAGPILADGSWVGFCFGGPGSPATVGCQNDGAQTSGNSFTFTAVGDRMVLQVTDAFTTGDTFAVYDFGVLLFTTNSVADGTVGTGNPDAAFASSIFSHGQILLTAGAHQIDIFNVHGCCNGGGAYMRVTVPEPGSLALIAVAMVGVVAMRRRKLR